MGEPVRVVSCPDPDYSGPRHEHLWLLVGGGDCFNGARAFYLGPDCDIEGDDLAARQIGAAVQAAESQGLSVNSEDAREALDDYRRSRDQTTKS